MPSRAGPTIHNGHRRLPTDTDPGAGSADVPSPWPRPVAAGGGWSPPAAEVLDGMAHRLLIEDRERIARELEADLLHSLFGIAIVLQGVAELCGDGPVGGRVEACVTGLDDCIRRLREHVFDLGHPGSPPDAGIRPVVAVTGGDEPPPGA